MSAGSSSGGTSIVYVAAFPDPRPAHDGAIVETRVLTSGEIAALAFSSRERLVAALGPAQPWIALPIEVLQAWIQAAGITTVALDAAVPVGARRWRDMDLAALEFLVRARGKEK
jgi:hypothetical protein